jgi:hypothetical protein
MQIAWILEMNNHVCFRSRRDVLHLIAAGAAPWLLIVFAKAPLRILQGLFNSQAEAEPFASLSIIWFYPVALAAMLIPMVLFFFGVWRIIRNRAYRWSLYGWLWLVVTWLGCGGVAGFAHSPE